MISGSLIEGGSSKGLDLGVLISSICRPLKKLRSETPTMNSADEITSIWDDMGYEQCLYVYDLGFGTNLALLLSRTTHRLPVRYEIISWLEST